MGPIIEFHYVIFEQLKKRLQAIYSFTIPLCSSILEKTSRLLQWRCNHRLEVTTNNPTPTSLGFCLQLETNSSVR